MGVYHGRAQELTAEQGAARKATHDAIAAYTAEMAGTYLDIDRDLESAGIEHMVKTGRGRK